MILNMLILFLVGVGLAVLCRVIEVNSYPTSKDVREIMKELKADPKRYKDINKKEKAK